MASTGSTSDKDLQGIAADLARLVLQRLAAGADASEMITAMLPRLVGRAGVSAAAVFEPAAGRWKLDGCSGSVDPPSESQVASAANQDLPARVDDWYFTAVGQTPSGPRLLGLASDIVHDSDIRRVAGSVREVFEGAIQFASEAELLRDMTARLERLLRESASWQRSEDTSVLFHRLAIAAAELLDAERASIFLLDARRGVLVAHPALGVDGEHLEVPADAGVVGAVMQKGLATRWSELEGADEVNRNVDSRLHFVTHSLCAAPIPDARGRTIGVFEVINKRDGAFTRQDQRILEAIASHAAGAIRGAQHREDLVRRRDALVQAAATGLEIIGDHPSIVSLKETVSRVAKTDLAVLVLGENGTGKEIVARNIHYGSARRSQPFVAVNCAALVETLLESELFGHVKGAFTDAASDRVGKFEQAHGGTLFLDEIGDMSPAGQAKLLRVLEEKKIVRVGGSQPIETDVRVIAATNRSLADRVQEGKFREDLYFRLSVVVLHLPPLRERGATDVLELAEFFLEKYCTDAGRNVPRISPAARDAIVRHAWPGNVRELRNVMERLAYLTTGDTIDASDLVFAASPRADDSGVPRGLTLAEATKQFQEEYIRHTIDDSGGNVTAAARALGLHRSNMYRKMRSLGMEPNEE